MKKLLFLIFLNSTIYTELFQDNSHIVQDNGTLAAGEEDSYLKIIYDSIKLSDPELFNAWSKGNCVWLFIGLTLSCSSLTILFLAFLFGFTPLNQIRCMQTDFAINSIMLITICCFSILVGIHTRTIYFEDKPKMQKRNILLNSLKSRLKNIEQLSIDKKNELQEEFRQQCLKNNLDKDNLNKLHILNMTNEVLFTNFDYTIRTIIDLFILNTPAFDFVYKKESCIYGDIYFTGVLYNLPKKTVLLIMEFPENFLL